MNKSRGDKQDSRNNLRKSYEQKTEKNFPVPLDLSVEDKSMVRSTIDQNRKGRPIKED